MILCIDFLFFHKNNLFQNEERGQGWRPSSHKVPKIKRQPLRPSLPQKLKTENVSVVGRVLRAMRVRRTSRPPTVRPPEKMAGETPAPPGKVVRKTHPTP